ncbi:hypothetical protein C8R43DRAFT_877406 [Mycena crocata]|nr:hypothetical protein C8R43DRAFT_877406 [Mycena crocata]
MGGSWLHLAVGQGDLPWAHECVRLGTAIQHKDNRGFSALYFACTLLKEANGPIMMNLRSQDGQMPRPAQREKLLRDVVVQIQQICLLLLEHHSDPNETHNGLSLLALACISNQWDLIRALLLHGACPSPSSTPAAQLPLRFLKSELDKKAFNSHVVEFSKTLRPRRPCPCGSTRLLENCHARPEPQPYSEEGICPCGAGKIHAKCCVKRKDMYWVERWDPHLAFLERVAIPRITTVPEYQNMGGKLYMNMPFEERQKEQRAHLDDSHLLLQKLAKSGRVDPGFAAAGAAVRFQPLLWVLHSATMSKVELNNAVQLWNEAVDVYIASKVDGRTRQAIENAAKVGPAGGPLHRRCEAAGCTKLEHRNGVKLLRCAGCNTTMYCSLDCQKSAWAGHKLACKSGEAKVQLLPSQHEFTKEKMTGLYKQIALAFSGGGPTRGGW